MTTNSKVTELGFRFESEAQGIVEYTCVANGLKVLLIENHSAPVVTSMVVYRVGSRNEAVGYTGSTHFLEHMMFKGTARFNMVEQLKPLGADFNATTSYDRTNYFAKVPSKYLRELITMESDRMRNLALRKSDRDSEMTVVRNEFEIGKNDPGSLLHEHLMATAFQEHPYHHPIIGWLDDVENVPLERMHEFYNTFYWPNNATLMVVGDFDTSECLQIIAETYGQIPAATHPIPQVYTKEPPQQGERRFKIVKPSTSPAEVVIGFHVPEAIHSDSYALSALATVLGDSGKRNSRLYKALVEKRLAVQCYAAPSSMKDPGLFILGGTCAPGVSPDQVEAALLAEIDKVRKELVGADELERAKMANRKSTALGSDNQMALLNQLCHAEVVGSWKEYIEFDDKYDQVTPADITAVVGRYFAEENRTVGVFVPQTKRNLVDGREDHAEAELEHSAAPNSSEAKSDNTFVARVHNAVAPNGMTVQVLRTPGTKTVAVALKVKSGDCFAPEGKTMVPTLTAMLLNKGTAKASKSDIARMLEQMSARMEFGSDTYNTNLNGKVVTSDFGAYIGLVASALRTPTFPEKDLEQAKLMLQSHLEDCMSDTDELADQKLKDALYPASSAHHIKPFDVQLAELASISVADLKAFHASFYSPKGTILSVAGDIEVEEAESLINQAFGDWEGPEARVITAGPVNQVEKAATHVIHVDDKTSVSILVGVPSTTRVNTPEYFVAKIANSALGGDTLSARLGNVLRKQHGLTYGISSAHADPFFGDGPWVIRLTVNPQNVDKAIKLIGEVVEQYRNEGITDQEFDAAVKGAIGSFMVRLDSPSAIAQAMSSYTFMGAGINGLDRVAANYQAVTKEAVNAYIRANFDLSKAVTVVAGTLV
jgi:zinc protease